MSWFKSGMLNWRPAGRMRLHCWSNAARSDLLWSLFKYLTKENWVNLQRPAQCFELDMPGLEQACQTDHPIAVAAHTDLSRFWMWLNLSKSSIVLIKSEIQYTGVSVSEQGEGSRYPNKTWVSVSELFPFLFGYRDPGIKMLPKTVKWLFLSF